MVCSSHVGSRVAGVSEASLASDVFVASLFQHSCRGLAGLSPSASREFASFESRNRRTGLKEQGCVLRSETVCPQVQFAAPQSKFFPDHRKRGVRGRGGIGKVLDEQCLLFEPRLDFHVFNQDSIFIAPI